MNFVACHLTNFTHGLDATPFGVIGVCFAWDPGWLVPSDPGLEDVIPLG